MIDLKEHLLISELMIQEYILDHLRDKMSAIELAERVSSVFKKLKTELKLEK